MYDYRWYQWILFFFVYAFAGWIFESAYVSVKKRRLTNRGFLRLPMLPLYGTGAVMMLFVSIPVKDNPVLVYILGFIAATVLEYVTGWGMEKLFHMRYWDYSDQKLNYKGYICLSSSIVWGFMTLFLTEVIHRPVERFVLSLKGGWAMAIVFAVGTVFVADTIQSVQTALSLGQALKRVEKIKRELEEATRHLAEARAEAAIRRETLKENREEQIKAKIEQLIQKRHDFYDQFSARYRNNWRHTLRRNPTAASGKYKDALKEIRIKIEESRKDKKSK